MHNPEARSPLAREHPSKRAIEVSRWYIPTYLAKHKWSPRWVLSVYRSTIDGRERVVYSDASEHYTCLRETFSKWIGASKAEIANGRESGWLETEQGQKEQKAGTQQNLQPTPCIQGD